jgi:hypothetical protein
MWSSSSALNLQMNAGLARVKKVLQYQSTREPAAVRDHESRVCPDRQMAAVRVPRSWCQAYAMHELCNALTRTCCHRPVRSPFMQSTFGSRCRKRAVEGKNVHSPDSRAGGGCVRAICTWQGSVGGADSTRRLPALVWCCSLEIRARFTQCDNGDCACATTIADCWNRPRDAGSGYAGAVCVASQRTRELVRGGAGSRLGEEFCVTCVGE